MYLQKVIGRKLLVFCCSMTKIAGSGSVRKCHGSATLVCLHAVLRIRIRIRVRIQRIHMFLGLLDLDPDPLVRGIDPDPDPIPIRFRILVSPNKNF
jgi:hypothetical protein